jgi:[ribosomal protein S5]-alanine N-acetyltransferase
MRLVTDRPILRDFVAEDWAAVLAYQSKPAYLQTYRWEAHTPADVKFFGGRAME